MPLAVQPDWESWIDEVRVISDRLESHAQQCPRCGGGLPTCLLCGRVTYLQQQLAAKVSWMERQRRAELTEG